MPVPALLLGEGPGLEELAGLAKEGAQDPDADGKGGADPEDFPPRARPAAHDQVAAGDEDVGEGVALLEDAGQEAADFGGRVLEGHGDGVAVPGRDLA